MFTPTTEFRCTPIVLSEDQIHLSQRQVPQNEDGSELGLQTSDVATEEDCTFLDSAFQTIPPQLCYALLSK
ncbi:hypothetical protein Pelo_2548 [Pelomyxa schiedti]|nr:hypothetical protein Pelo_2548 [Pelomyxa schiedti]